MILNGIRGRVSPNRDLAGLTWLRVGGPADHLFQPADTEDLAAFLGQLDPVVQVFPMGVGSNLIVRDGGLRAVVVRLGRGLLRRDPSLVLLDEPFRGLDRATRRRLLGELRSTWAAATLVCVTHDVGDVADFERVVVVDGGRIVEDGVPAELLADEGSHYARLVASEAEVRHSAWGGEGWRRVVLDDGQAVDA